ncbi:MAG: acyl-CoA thioesterase [Muribaculaceae bacterium]|nr:acyl-CoA thioesterase [Bacteroides sp.]MDE7495632.1 acyl-CoA thioesterase [Muribaculaceae bacterium]
MNPHNIPSPASFNHRCPVQLRFNDVDILGHVNNTVYFSFYDTGKAQYFRAVRRGKMDFRKVETVIANINCAYINSIYYGEDIELLTRCEVIKDKSFILLQMLRERNTGEVKSICETVMVSIDTETHKAVPVPEDWRHDLQLYEGRDLSRPAGSEV